MLGAIAITDYGWYAFLSARPQLTEANFWTPSARTGFRSEPFSPFLFKLKAPHNAVCGFAHFAQYSRLPDWLAWETFETLQERTAVREEAPRYGAAQLVAPRLGQGTFRVAVLEAYSRACCVTGEHSLPALEASHIRPYARAGPHEVSNGLLFRADLHRLFDKDYITVTPELRLEVGARLRDEFHNGRSYYPLDGTRLQVPKAPPLTPSSEYLQWHNEHASLG